MTLAVFINTFWPCHGRRAHRFWPNGSATTAEPMYGGAPLTFPKSAKHDLFAGRQLWCCSPSTVVPGGRRRSRLTKETRTPVLMQKHQPARLDYEYERNGTANLRMMFAPLKG
jgi:hypothetical protein